ncbi:DUF924 family protein [Rosenbergiella nectarea]|uniref:DUF924 family protein n=1 Tax=Rosenbergiella nectarea TaxID=988801 RepID=UPI001BDAB863|nr:DUF924 family protein [Rosenbergiella nectarea]MBT0731085.1 DUF924 domain-containing protein [Rosenbergiella nectarea subsp. apis]
MGFHDVIEFWFSEKSLPNWFTVNRDFDHHIRHQFLETWRSACRGELYPWRQQTKGRLAEIIVLDQFSRNLNRDSSQAYQQDGQALILSQELVFSPGWQELNQVEQAVALLPWMHSESVTLHQQAEAMYAKVGHADFNEFEQRHSQIIKQFGRYPHRNAIMGRISSPQEMDWLLTHDGF